MESLITRFTKENPCWTEELLAKAGEDVSLLPGLTAEGILTHQDGIYFLTKSGTAAFESAAKELYIEADPGHPSNLPTADVFRTKLRLLLDGAHAQRWGIKEFLTRARLPYLPAAETAFVSFNHDEMPHWAYEHSDAYRAMARDFPSVTIDARRTDLVPQERIERWAKDNGAVFGELAVDLLYLCRYDFMQYKDFSGHPNDPLRLINTDRFLFVIAAPTSAENLAKVGAFHLWLNYLRRMQIPGYVDRDTQEQDSVSWLLLTVEKEKEAVELADALAPFGAALVQNANPCEVWAISLEALERLDAKRELVWELLPEIAHPIQRTLA